MRTLHIKCTFRKDGIKMRGPSLTNIINTVIALVATVLTIQLDLTAAAANHYLVLHPCLFPTHMRVVFSVTKELVKVRKYGLSLFASCTA